MKKTLRTHFLCATCCLLVLRAMTGSDAATLPKNVTANDSISANLATLKKDIPPLKNNRDGRWPLTFWNPAPQDPLMMKAWAERGLIPLSVGDWNKTPALPFLRYLQDHQMPVIFLAQGLMQRAFKDSGKPFGDQQSPAWLLDNPRVKAEANQSFQLAKSLKAVGITPKSIWIDFEAGAYLRNNGDLLKNVRKAMDATLKNPPDVKRFGAERLNNPQQYQAVVNEARSQLIRESFSDPIHSLFPNTSLGNYYTWPIRRSIKLNPSQYQGRYPAYGYENSGMTVMQPRCYFTVSWGASAKASQEQVSWNIFQYCLDRFSRAARVKKPDEKMVPWIGYLFSKGGGGKVSMKKAAAGGQIASPQAYEEMVRQVMMRGAETFAIFSPAILNDAFPKEYPADFPRRQLGPLLLNLVDAQKAYDDMLHFNLMLRQGKVMNYEVPDKEHPGPVWSGLETKAKALIRTVTFGNDEVNAIAVFGKTVKLPFKKQGQFFWVYPDGHFLPVS